MGSGHRRVLGDAEPVGGSAVRGTRVLADGRVITLGGWDRSGISLGLNEVDVFEPNVKAWNRVRPMNFKRWYPTAHATARRPRARAVRIAQLAHRRRHHPGDLRSGCDTWTSLTGAVRRFALPLLFVLPDGRVIISATPRCRRVPGARTSRRRRGRSSTAGPRSTADPRTFAPGKFLKAGTAADSGNSGLAAITAYTLDMNQGTPTWQPTGSMAFPRLFLNLTKRARRHRPRHRRRHRQSAFINANGVLPPRSGSPATEVDDDGGHGDAAALSLGRAAAAGRARLVWRRWLDTASTDQRTAQIFSPPYLFKGARPTIYLRARTVPARRRASSVTPDAASIAGSR